MTRRITQLVIQYPRKSESFESRLTHFVVQVANKISPVPPPTNLTQLVIQYPRRISPAPPFTRLTQLVIQYPRRVSPPPPWTRTTQLVIQVVKVIGEGGEPPSEEGRVLGPAVQVI